MATTKLLADVPGNEKYHTPLVKLNQQQKAKYHFL